MGKPKLHTDARITSTAAARKEKSTADENELQANGRKSDITKEMCEKQQIMSRIELHEQKETRKAQRQNKRTTSS